MARPNGSGGSDRREDDEPDLDRTVRTRASQKAIDDHFSDDPEDESQGGGR